MGAPLSYRNAVPELSSSSPLQSMASLSSSPPLSPQSPTPQRRATALLEPTTSNPHPFSGSAKAAMGSHPSFDKYELRPKHMRGSAERPPTVPSTHSTWALSGNRGGPILRKEEALEQHFYDSSDDNPSSDGVGSWAPSLGQSYSSLLPNERSSASAVGLGIDAIGRDSRGDTGAPTQLGEAFQESGSPSMGRKARVRTFSRTQSSSKDPFSAGAGSSMSMNALVPSPSSRPPTAQRRRLTGSSPRKLSRATQMSGFGGGSSESSDEGLSAWEQKAPAPTAVDWNTVVEQVFERVDGNMELSRQGLTRIDPVIADLSKFVSIPPLRREESTGLSQVASSTSPFERTASSSSLFGSPNSRNRHTGDQASSKLLLYLAGNRLEIFPSALFELHNLAVLSIRDNNLEELPPAIGQLVNLRELNVSQNRLKYLPAEMQRLRLDSFTHFPNPFLLPPPDAPLVVRRVLGLSYSAQGAGEGTATPTPPPASPMGPPALPLRRHSRLVPRSSFAMAGQSSSASSVGPTECADVQLARCLPRARQSTPRLPSLIETCIRVLLEPDEADEQGQILLEQYESGCLANLNKSLDGSIIKSLEAARRSAIKAWGRVRPAAADEGTWCSGAAIGGMRMGRGRATKAHGALSASSDPLAEHFEQETDDDGEASNEWSGEEDARPQQPSRPISVEEELDRGDDSKRNPWFNRCPSPRHYEDIAARTQRTSETTTCFDWPGPVAGGRVFARPGVQRLEWVSHVAGVAVSQVRLEEVAAVQNAKTPILAYGTGCIPLQWRGCGPSCLDFLE